MDQPPHHSTQTKRQRWFGLKPLRDSYFMTGGTWVRLLCVFSVVMSLVLALWIALFHDIGQRRGYAKDRAFAQLSAYAGMVARHFDTSILVVDITLSYLRQAWLQSSASFPQQVPTIVGSLAGYASAQICVLDGAGEVQFEYGFVPRGNGITCDQVNDMPGFSPDSNAADGKGEDQLFLSPTVLRTGAVDTVIAFSRSLSPELGRASGVIVLLVSGSEIAHNLDYKDIPPGVSYGALTQENKLLWLETLHGESIFRQYLNQYDEKLQQQPFFQLRDNDVRRVTSYITGEDLFLAVEKIEKYGIWAVATMSASSISEGTEELWNRYRIFGGLFTTVLLMWGLVIFLYVQRRVESQGKMLLDFAQLQAREQELEQSRLLLKSLMSREITSRDLEESRIAREIHDDLGQRLAVLRMDVAQLTRKGEAAAIPVLSRRLAEVLAQINDIIAAMRSIVRSILPTDFHLGLKAVLQTLVEGFTAKTGVVVTLISELPEDDLIDERLAFTVYRIVQEALTNIANHSEASHGLVSLAVEDDVLHLSIADNGKGFAESGHNPSFGLKSITERAMMVGGEVEIASNEGLGVTIGVKLPLIVGY